VSAVVAALGAVRGDLGGGERRFQQALARVELDARDGRIRLDRRRQAIASSFAIQWHLNRNGKLEWKPLLRRGTVAGRSGTVVFATVAKITGDPFFYEDTKTVVSATGALTGLHATLRVRWDGAVATYTGSYELAH
jgi:hypothetical protein